MYIRSRPDDGLFNLARLRATSKTTVICVRGLLYADDSALVATSQDDIQEITDLFVEAATCFRLQINATKTELLYQPSPLQQEHEQPLVEVNGEALKNTDAKIKVYNTAVLPSLRYSTETLILYPRHIKQLTRVKLRHLRQIMNIKWKDRIPDVTVLQRGAASVEALIV